MASLRSRASVEETETGVVEERTFLPSRSPRRRARSPPHRRDRSPPHRRNRSPPHRRERSPPHRRERSPAHRRDRSPPRRRPRSPPPRRDRSDVPKASPKGPSDELFDENNQPVDAPKKFFEWLNAKRHKQSWVVTGDSLLDPESVEGTKLLSAEGSRILLTGFNESETSVTELRAEVQLFRGKVSPPLKKTEPDPKTRPSDEDLKNGRKSIVTKIAVLNGEAELLTEVNGAKSPLCPALILVGILEHKEGSKDQENAREMAKQMFLVAAAQQMLQIA